MTRRAVKLRAARMILATTFALIAMGLAATDRGRPEDRPRTTIQADAALVLSGDVDYLRLKHASALVREGRVRAILLTGKGVGGDSAEEMRKQALAEGVPDGAIVLETASTSTRENVLFAAPIVRRRGWQRVALVTSASHMARALAAARKVMPEVDWVPAPVPDAGSMDRARRLRALETLKLLVYKARGWA